MESEKTITLFIVEEKKMLRKYADDCHIKISHKNAQI